MTTTMVRVAAPRHRGVVWPVIGMIALGVCGLAAVGLGTTEVGVGGVLIGAVVALLPVGPVVAAFLWVDRWEPEPPRMLLAAFLWGAGAAALVALVVNSSAAMAAEQLLGRHRADLVGALGSAPLVEEFAKGIFVVGVLLRRRREFDGLVDGVVYAGITAAGFAFTENILYFGRAFTETHSSPLAGLAWTFVMRGVVAPFAHPLFTSLTGLGVGIAAWARSRAVGTFAILGGYLVAVGLHALWNLSSELGDAFIGVYVLIMVPVFSAVVGMVLWQRHRERATLARELPGFAAAGWIADSEVPLLSSMPGRRRWQAAVRRRSGPAAGRAVANYQHAVTELAFLRSRAAAGALEARPEWHAELLTAVRRTRAEAVAAGAQPRGEMVAGAQPRGEMVAGAQPRGEMVAGAQPRGEMVAGAQPRGEMVPGAQPRGGMSPGGPPRGGMAPPPGGSPPAPGRPPAPPPGPPSSSGPPPSSGASPTRVLPGSTPGPSSPPASRGPSRSGGSPGGFARPWAPSDEDGSTPPWRPPNRR